VRFACQITMAKIHTAWYLIFIAFPWQPWLCERVSVLRGTHIGCRVEACEVSHSTPVPVRYTRCCTSESLDRCWTRLDDTGQSFLTYICVRILGTTFRHQSEGFYSAGRKWTWVPFCSVMILWNWSRKCCKFSKSIQSYLIPADTEIREDALLS